MSNSQPPPPLPTTPPAGTTPFALMDINKVRNLVESEFIVNEYRVEFDIPTFIVTSYSGNTKEPFKRLVQKMKAENFLPFLRKKDGHLIIQVLPKPPVTRSRPIINLILLIGTFGTVFYFAGYLQASSPIYTDFLLFPPPFNNVMVQSLLLTIALMGIIGLHELGHKIACEFKGIEATMPYFIPGPPPFGTLGAVIMQKEPPVNRDQLFDLGFSGPIAGFAISVMVTIFAIIFAVTVPENTYNELLRSVPNVVMVGQPLIWTIIEYLVVNIYPALYSPGNVLIPPPFWFAAWVGYLITFLNLLPIWQLDGGHISRALFGDRGHKVASAVGLIITFLGGYWFFGLLILLFMWRSKSAGPLDDVTPIANSKKALGILAYVILGLCFVMISPIF